MDKSQSNLINRTNMVGGQAVIEGVMMKKGDNVALAVRKEDGTVEIKKSEFASVRKKAKPLNWPIVRGIIAFFESLVLSFKTLSASTDMLDLEDDKKKKEGKNNEKKSSASTIAIMIVSVVLGLALALVLFTIIPTFVAGVFLPKLLAGYEATKWYGPVLALVEGALKVLIFIGYLSAVSLMKDIRRTFQYHGAEHKAIACFESGKELTVKNARKCTRFHPRCGTSFMFVMILLSILVSCFIPASIGMFLRILIKILLIPIIMGIGYEFIMYAGKNENTVTRILSAPGLWMQRITTKEPTDDQLQIAICAIKASVPEFYPSVSLEEYAISEAENRDHIGNVGKKYPKEKPLYQLPKTKEEIYYRSANCVDTTAPIYVMTRNGEQSSTFTVKSYTKKSQNLEIEAIAE